MPRYFPKEEKPEEPRPRCTSYRNEGAAGNKPKQKRSYTTREQWYFYFLYRTTVAQVELFFHFVQSKSGFLSTHPRTHRINVWAPIRETTLGWKMVLSYTEFRLSCSSQKNNNYSPLSLAVVKITI